MDRLGYAGHTRCVDEREIGPIPNGRLERGLNFSAAMLLKNLVEDVNDSDVAEILDADDDLVHVIRAGRVDRDLAGDLIARGLDEFDGANVAAGLADRGREFAEHAGHVADLRPQREAVARRRADFWFVLGCHGCGTIAPGTKRVKEWTQLRIVSVNLLRFRPQAFGEIQEGVFAPGRAEELDGAGESVWKSAPGDGEAGGVVQIADLGEGHAAR